MLDQNVNPVQNKFERHEPLFVDLASAKEMLPVRSDAASSKSDPCLQPFDRSNPFCIVSDNDGGGVGKPAALEKGGRDQPQDVSLVADKPTQPAAPSTPEQALAKMLGLKLDPEATKQLDLDLKKALKETKDGDQIIEKIVSKNGIKNTAELFAEIWKAEPGEKQNKVGEKFNKAMGELMESVVADSRKSGKEFEGQKRDIALKLELLGQALNAKLPEGCPHKFAGLKVAVGDDKKGAQKTSFGFEMKEKSTGKSWLYPCPKSVEQKADPLALIKPQFLDTQATEQAKEALDSRALYKRKHPEEDIVKNGLVKKGDIEEAADLLRKTYDQTLSESDRKEAYKKFNKSMSELFETISANTPNRLESYRTLKTDVAANLEELRVKINQELENSKSNVTLGPLQLAVGKDDNTVLGLPLIYKGPKSDNKPVCFDMWRFANDSNGYRDRFISQKEFDERLDIVGGGASGLFFRPARRLLK